MSDSITTPQSGEPDETMAQALAVDDPNGAGTLPPEYPQNYRRTIALVLIAAAGMYIMMLTLSTALSLRLAAIDPDTKETTLSLAVSFSALLQLVAIPLGGALSDRTTSRFGRRRPWIVGMLAIALVAMAVIGAVASTPVIIAAYVVGITAAQLGFSSYAVIPVEGIPDNMRGRVMGMMGMFGALAMSAGAYIAGAFINVPLLMMTMPVLLAILCSIPLLLLYKDPRKAASDVPPLDVAGLFKNLVANPRKHPDFAWAWLSRFLAGVAMTGLFTYFVFFLIDGLGTDYQDVAGRVAFLSILSAPVSIIFFTGSGWLSDKIGRRKPFVAMAAVFMGLALVIAGTATTFTQFIVAWLVFAVGQAMYLTVDLALCAAVLPDAKDTGKDMGVFQLALSIPNIVVPLIAPAVLAVGTGHNYMLLWGICAVAAALGAVAIYRVKGVR